MKEKTKKGNMFLDALMSSKDLDSVLPPQEDTAIPYRPANQMPVEKATEEVVEDKPPIVSPPIFDAPRETNSIENERMNLLSDLSSIQTPGKEKSEIQLGTKNKKEETPIQDTLIMSGIPLVISALMGDIGVGAGVAGNEMMRQMTAAEKAEAKAKSGDSSRLYKYMDEDGKEMYGSKKDAYGKTPASYYSTMESRTENAINKAKAQKDIAVDKFKEQETLKGNLGEEFQGMQINKKDIDDVKLARSRFDKYAAKPIESLNNSKKIRSLLKLSKSKNNIVAYQSAVKEYAKILEGGGRLTDFDVQMVSDRLSSIRNASKRLYQEKSGKPSPTVVQEIEEAMRDIEIETRKAVKATGSKIAKGMSNSRTGFKPQKQQWLLENLDITPDGDSNSSEEDTILVRNKRTGEEKRIPRSQVGR